MFVLTFTVRFVWLFFGRAQYDFWTIILFYLGDARRLGLFLINVGCVIGQFCAGARSRSFLFN